MADDTTTTTRRVIPTMTLRGRLEYPDKTPFTNTTKITLNDNEYTTYSRADGTFVIYHVLPGIHQLDVHSPTHHFGQIKCQLLEETMMTTDNDDDVIEPPKCLEYAYPGAMKQSTKYPLVLTAYATYVYFEPRQGFSIWALVKNPMVLMMLFSVFMMFVMPKMMENLDPEEKAKMKQQMQNQQDPTKMLSQMWGELTGAQEQPTARARRSPRVKRD